VGKTKISPKKLKVYKQLTLDNLPIIYPKESNNPLMQKQIIIVEIPIIITEDELALRVWFRLYPSKTAFSKLNLDLWFDNQQISSRLIRIPQGPLSADELELPLVLDMKGISAGAYLIRVEMYELWSDGEKLSFTQKEVAVHYVPQTREPRLIKIPIVKSFGETCLAVVCESDKDIYREIEATMKKESDSKRDEW
jgi:arsenate reductase-like glutaredoxin family protein